MSGNEETTIVETHNGVFWEGVKGPLYPEIINSIRGGIQQTILYVDELSNRLWESLRRLDEIEARPNIKTCPFCAGRMIDLAPLADLTDGRELTQGGTPLDPYYRFRWECQSCGVYTTSPPRYVNKSWVREDFTEKRSQNLAARIFQHFPAAKQVTYNIADQEWFLLIDDNWFRFTGAKKNVLEQLGINS